MQKRPGLLHSAYLVAILIKGFDGAVETILGGIVWLFGPDAIHYFVARITAPELDLHRRAVHLLQSSTERLAHASPAFVVIYLLAHGVLKLGIAIGLLQDKRWIFPVATVVLLGFIAYMGFHLARHWSGWLLGFALFDALTVVLVLREWRSMGAAKTA